MVPSDAAVSARFSWAADYRRVISGIGPTGAGQRNPRSEDSNQLTPERLLFVPQGLKDSVLRHRLLPSLDFRARPQSATSRSPPPRPDRSGAECRRTGRCANGTGDPPGSGVTCPDPGPRNSRHRSTRRWTPPMNEVRSYCCASVPQPLRGLMEDYRGLPRAILLRLRDRRDGHLAPLAEDPVRRLRVPVESRVAGRVLVRRVQDRLLEESEIRHGTVRYSFSHRDRRDHGREHE